MPSRCRRYLYLCCCKNNVGECLRHLTDATAVSLLGDFGQIRDDPLYHSNAAIDIGSQYALVECSSFSRSHWSVGSKTSSKLDRGIHDVVIRVRLCWGRRLRVDHDIMDSWPVRLTGEDVQQ